jgi:uncharacterized membrane protein
MKERFVDNLRGIAYVTSHPQTDRFNRLSTTGWIASGVLALVSILSYISLDQWASPVLWVMVALLAVDAYMLSLCIQGIRYRRTRRGKVRRRA